MKQVFVSVYNDLYEFIKLNICFSFFQKQLNFHLVKFFYSMLRKLNVQLSFSVCICRIRNSMVYMHKYL